MTDFIQQALADRPTGLALHYPLLHAAIVGLGARLTLEFGAGGSTRVISDALGPGGVHRSISTESWKAVAERNGINLDRCDGGAVWFHVQGDSQERRGELDRCGPFDLILHDGSHAADVVAGDIAWAWPRLRPFGLLLVHDTQHSYCGAEMRAGLADGLARAEAMYSATTLPYGFGLTIIRKEHGDGEAVRPAVAKVGSAHTTELTPMFLRAAG